MSTSRPNCDIAVLESRPQCFLVLSARSDSGAEIMPTPTPGWRSPTWAGYSWKDPSTKWVPLPAPRTVPWVPVPVPVPKTPPLSKFHWHPASETVPETYLLSVAAPKTPPLTPGLLLAKHAWDKKLAQVRRRLRGPVPPAFPPPPKAPNRGPVPPAFPPPGRTPAALRLPNPPAKIIPSDSGMANQPVPQGSTRSSSPLDLRKYVAELTDNDAHPIRSSAPPSSPLAPVEEMAAVEEMAPVETASASAPTPKPSKAPTEKPSMAPPPARLGLPMFLAPQPQFRRLQCPQRRDGQTRVGEEPLKKRQVVIAPSVNVYTTDSDRKAVPVEEPACVARPTSTRSNRPSKCPPATESRHPRRHTDPDYVPGLDGP